MPSARARSEEGTCRETLKTETLQKAAREAQLLCGLQRRAPIMIFGGHKEEVSK